MKDEANQVHEFLASDKINPVKFRANAELMKNETLEIYKARIKLHSEPDLSKDITQTIEWMANILHQPIVYPVWFMTAYPDVVFWFSELEQEKMTSIVGNLSENDMIGAGRKTGSLF